MPAIGSSFNANQKKSIEIALAIFTPRMETWNVTFHDAAT
jgi:hypothetical protein